MECRRHSVMFAALLHYLAPRRSSLCNKNDRNDSRSIAVVYVYVYSVRWQRGNIIIRSWSEDAFKLPSGPRVCVYVYR